MCWSGEASAALATAGFVTTALAARRGESPLLWSPLAYFTLMEALQGYTYSVIDNCGSPANQVATLLGYLHITFQPFFVNAVGLYFIDKRIAQKIAPFVYSCCFVAAIIMLVKLYPYHWAARCTPGLRPMCGPKICAYHGNWHIAWSVPVSDISDRVSWYFIVAFLLPLLYGSWRWTLYHLITGPGLARITTSNLNEWPAVWCLFSIDLLIIITNTQVRHWLHVRRWWWWRLDKDKAIPGNEAPAQSLPEQALAEQKLAEAVS